MKWICFPITILLLIIISRYIHKFDDIHVVLTNKGSLVRSEVVQKMQQFCKSSCNIECCLLERRFCSENSLIHIPIEN